MTIRVLVVDDDREVLAGLRRALHRFRDRFACTFVASVADAEAALHAQAGLDEGPFDLAVVEPALTGPAGQSVLSLLRARHPDVVRIAFSATVDARRCVDVLADAHRFVGKPCTPEQLVAHLEESVGATRGCLDRVAQALRAMAEPRAQPNVYGRALEELLRQDASLRTLAQIVEGDLGITTRMLKLANSAWFGSARPITRIDRALVHLGLETVRGAMLLLGAASMAGADAEAAEALADHGLEVGALAARLAPRGSADELRSAALLHDIGRLGFVAVAPLEYQAMIDGCAGDETALVVAECGRFGGDHAQCGAFLLGLWGLPAQVVELVRRHHETPTCDGGEPTPHEALALADLACSGRLGAWAAAAPTADARAHRSVIASRLQPTPSMGATPGHRDASLH